MLQLQRALSDKDLKIAHAPCSGCTQQQAAEMLDISQAAVAQRIRRIKEIVRRLIDAR